MEMEVVVEVGVELEMNVKVNFDFQMVIWTLYLHLYVPWQQIDFLLSDLCHTCLNEYLLRITKSSRERQNKVAICPVTSVHSCKNYF